MRRDPGGGCHSHHIVQAQPGSVTITKATFTMFVSTYPMPAASMVFLPRQSATRTCCMMVGWPIFTNLLEFPHQHLVPQEGQAQASRSAQGTPKIGPHCTQADRRRTSS